MRRPRDAWLTAFLRPASMKAKPRPNSGPQAPSALERAGSPIGVTVDVLGWHPLAPGSTLHGRPCGETEPNYRRYRDRDHRDCRRRVCRPQFGRRSRCHLVGSRADRGLRRSRSRRLRTRSRPESWLSVEGRSSHDTPDISAGRFALDRHRRREGVHGLHRQRYFVDWRRRSNTRQGRD